MVAKATLTTPEVNRYTRAVLTMCASEKVEDRVYARAVLRDLRDLCDKRVVMSEYLYPIAKHPVETLTSDERELRRLAEKE